MIHSISAFVAMLAVVSAVSRTSVMKPFTQGNAFKVIAGLNNFDASIVKNVVSAACAGGASHVDLACDASLVRLAKTISSEMPVCVSSIKPTDFVAAVEAGADMIEIGNFDAFYEQGLKFTAEDVISMTIETRTLLPNIPLSVTVPHTLTLAEQVALAIRLEECGADIIQTEGKMSVSSSSMGVQEMIELAAPTLAAGNYSNICFIIIPITATFATHTIASTSSKFIFTCFRTFADFSTSIKIEVQSRYSYRSRQIFYFFSSSSCIDLKL